MNNKACEGPGEAIKEIARELPDIAKRLWDEAHRFMPNTFMSVLGAVNDVFGNCKPVISYSVKAQGIRMHVKLEIASALTEELEFDTREWVNEVASALAERLEIARELLEVEDKTTETHFDFTMSFSYLDVMGDIENLEVSRDCLAALVGGLLQASIDHNEEFRDWDIKKEEKKNLV